MSEAPAVADNGYYSEKEVEQAHSKGVEAYIAVKSTVTGKVWSSSPSKKRQDSPDLRAAEMMRRLFKSKTDGLLDAQKPRPPSAT